MIDGSQFFSLARKWKEEGNEDILPLHFYILQAVMNHYFGYIIGDNRRHLLEINGIYQAEDISFVLDAIGYHDYDIQRFLEIGKILVILRDTL